LDCCHSGAFCPSIRSSNIEPTKALIERGYFVGEGRIAFVSSPKGVSSRERTDFKNGIFTHFLLEGLKGGAATQTTNEVTMSSLISYVENKAPKDQPPVHYGQATKMILTRPNIGTRNYRKSVSVFQRLSDKLKNFLSFFIILLCILISLFIALNTYKPAFLTKILQQSPLVTDIPIPTFTPTFPPIFDALVVPFQN